MAETGNQRKVQLKVVQVFVDWLSFSEVVKHGKNAEGMGKIMVRNQVIVFNNLV